MSYPQVSFRETTFENGSFWHRKRDVVRRSTIPSQLEKLKQTGRYDAFKLKWRPGDANPPHIFWDSDIAKWMEGAIYFLDEEPDIAIDNAVKELTAMIERAQDPDGYINSHFTVVEPDKEWTNLRDLHELYCCGHLIEAALAHQDHYGNGNLLDTLIGYADLLCGKFGPDEDQTHGYSGHPEIELALLRLHARTGEIKYLNLAKYFIEERGNPKGVDGRHFYDAEVETRGEHPSAYPRSYPQPRSYWYQQAHKPILEQETVEGHSVRAMYLFTGVADASIYDGDFKKKYLPVLERLWNNMVLKKMYLTGGIGSIDQWEGFGHDYFLPQSTDEGGGYAETCASIGVMMLAERMLQLDLNAKYSDIMELCLYNAVLGGISLDGKAFTYVNQLASSNDNPSRREEWFDCACCPPNVTRLLGSLGGYLWTHFETGPSAVQINVHLYAAARLEFGVAGHRVRLTQKTSWPWVGVVEFELEADQSVDASLRLRIPQWAESWSIEPAMASPICTKGYLELPASWTKENPRFALSIPLKPRHITPHPNTHQPVSAVARGPIVYCVEDVDNAWVPPGDHFKTVVLNTSVPLEDVRTYGVKDDEAYFAVKASNAARLFRIKEDRCAPDSDGNVLLSKPETLKFIPFYVRANRGGNGQMRVAIRSNAS